MFFLCRVLNKYRLVVIEIAPHSICGIAKIFTLHKTMRERPKKVPKSTATTRRHSVDTSRIQKPVRRSLETATPNSDLSNLPPNAFSNCTDKVMKYMRSRSTPRTTLKVMNAFGERITQIFSHSKEELDSAIPMCEREQIIMDHVGPSVCSRSNKCQLIR